MSPTASRAAGVALRGLGRRFGAHTVLRDIELEIAPGEVIALVGRSGSGKSTLLRVIAGLDEPTEGEVVLDGRPMRGIDPRCAVVFQEPRLLPWRDLAGNVALGLPPTISRAEGEAEVRRGLEIVGLAGFEGHRPRQVSGGMAQRTALARALVRHPGVLLLDEPFAALDALTRLRMQDLLDEVQRAAGITVVLVTHDVDEALRLTDRVVVLETVSGETGFTIGTAMAVSADRPRDDSDPRLAALRLDLLERLGVPRRATVKETL
ncbi:ABC transporter ATP-binding protein [Nocardia sp. CA-135398]|uniref:ABC transporter ATP-binding protein n=1 Tax=Nocardia sp. CA-135398 TaxID=3239977 RepID=UPI003D999344